MLSTASDQTYAHAPLGYPAHLVSTRRLSDGTNITIRPIRAEDDASERAFISGLSRDTVYNRLLGARKLTPDEIRHLTRIDYQREMAFVALTANGRGARQLGVARYIRDSEGSGAEFALVVADAWQHRGVGSVLLDKLLQHALAVGIERLHGITLANNQAMQNLARKLGFVQKHYPGDATLRQVEKTLAVGFTAAAVRTSSGYANTIAANDARIASPI